MPKHITGKIMENNTEYEWDIYQPTPKMSTYILGIAVLNGYVSVQKQFGKRNISTYSPEKTPDNEYNLNHTLKLLSIFEEYLNATEELPKIDSLHAIAGHYGAMENWGLIVYYTSHLTSIRLIAHELAHFWFGNLVTCENWNE